METTKHSPRTAHRFIWPRILAAGVAVGGLSASAIVVSSVGAAVRSSSKNVVVSTAKTATGAKILVSGKTVYTLKSSATACSAACLKVWPELVLPKGVKKAKAGSGVTASKLGTVKRSGGVLQVTYSGKALYLFSGDTASGQVNGNVSDEWGKWSDVTIKAAASKSSSGGSSSGGSSAGSGGVGF
jgi:predicted lipoprotein with Yx(FWY)xxD motif